MEIDAKNIVGICGLYCGTCPYYLAPRTNDWAMIEKLSRDKGLAPEELRCDGCLSERVSSHCRDCRHGFRNCAAAHGVTWCFECAEFPCQLLGKFKDVHIVQGISHHARVIQDLAYMKAKGVESWVRLQERTSRCPTCGKTAYWFDRVCSSCHTLLR